MEESVLIQNTYRIEIQDNDVYQRELELEVKEQSSKTLTGTD